MDGYFLFTDRLEFSSGLETNSEQKQKISATLAKEVEAFLLEGGSIDEVEYNPIPEIIARVGEWTPMGDALLGYDLDGGTEDD
jgi:hypothetical protein